MIDQFKHLINTIKVDSNTNESSIFFSSDKNALSVRIEGPFERKG